MITAQQCLPTILLLSLNKEPWHHDLMNRLLSAIKRNACLIDAENVSVATKTLATNPAAVLVADAAITHPKNRDLAKKIADYSRNGGTVILGCMMSCFATPPQFNALLKDVWKMSWRFGDYVRDDSVLDAAAIVPKLEDPTKTSLPLAVNIKAVYLKQTAKADRLYTSRSYAKGQASVAITRVGNGFLGWIGDVNNEEEMDAIYLSLLLSAKKYDSDDGEEDII